MNIATTLEQILINAAEASAPAGVAAAFSGQQAGPAMLTAAKNSAISQIEGLLGGATPQTQQVVGAGATFLQSILSHPSVQAEVASGLSLALSFLPQSFKF